MSFEPIEVSQRDGEPTFLYLFSVGPAPTDVVALTNAERPVSHMGIIYVPVPVRHNGLTQSGTLDKAAIEVSTSRDSDIALLFRIYPPSFVVSLTIFQGHADDEDAEFLVVWTGRVVNCLLTGLEASLTCQPIATALARPGLRRNYQISCPHLLYGPQCKALKIKRAFIVDQVTGGNTITVQSSDGLAVVAEQLQGGVLDYISPQGLNEIRTILTATAAGSTVGLRLAGSTYTLEPSMTIFIARGCKHDTNDCRFVHDNIGNYGGHPYIPNANPHSSATFFA